jgi:hypothetical protein
VELDDTIVEHIAQAIHELYLATQRRRGLRPGDSPAMVPWARLSDDVREANRAQARHIAHKLRAIGCEIRPGAGRGFDFSAGELDRLARAEHQRWCDQRRQAGWSYGPERDEGAKHHPGLVPWDELPELERLKDRDAVTNIPTLLARAQLQVTRRPPF